MLHKFFLISCIKLVNYGDANVIYIILFGKLLFGPKWVEKIQNKDLLRGLVGFSACYMKIFHQRFQIFCMNLVHNNRGKNVTYTIFHGNSFLA